MRFPTPEWDPETHLEFMKKLGITTTMLSISAPHVNFGDDNAAKILAREVNEDGAELVKKYPGRFGILASLPLPDVESSIEEIGYATDVLQTDGFALPTNSQGVYLGHPSLDPIFAELNRRKAVVVLHPNKPSAVPEDVLQDLPIAVMEFFFDTTRTVMNMMIQGTLRRFPEIKLVVPHAGAFLPILADRVKSFLRVVKVGEDDKLDIFAALRNLYYDVAGACLPRQLSVLLQIASDNHLLYGSDYPFTPGIGCMQLANALDKTDLLTQEQRRGIYRDNALKLFPRLNRP